MDALDRFGEFFIRNSRDKALNDLEFMFQHKWRTPALQSLQDGLAQLGDDQHALIREVVERVMMTTMHDLLFAFQEASDRHQGIQIIVDGQDVAQLSDGLQGEPFSAEGWIARFSKYPYQEDV